MKYQIKIIIHVSAIMFFLIGIIFIHAVMNNTESMGYFFAITINRDIVFDLGFVFIGIAFFLEFCLTFKPIEVNKNG